ncbi:MAG: IclR family transcriptional regulator [Pseudomonadota bacterium]
MTVHDSPRGQGIQVISRAAAVLRLLGQETGGLSLGQIAAHVDLPRSTVQRIVGALSAEGFVSTGGGSGRIKLGPEIQSLGLSLTIGPLDRLRPIMRQISEATGETVDLAILRDGRMLFVDQIVGRHRLRTVSSIGETFPLATTANGKAALSCLDEAAAATLLEMDLHGTPVSEQRRSELLLEIAAIRNGALAADEDEHTDGISALGFGVADRSGEVLALSVPVPSSRYLTIKDTLVAALTAARHSLAKT